VLDYHRPQTSHEGGAGLSQRISEASRGEVVDLRVYDRLLFSKKRPEARVLAGSWKSSQGFVGCDCEGVLNKQQRPSCHHASVATFVLLPRQQESFFVLRDRVSPPLAKLRNVADLCFENYQLQVSRSYQTDGVQAARGSQKRSSLGCSCKWLVVRKNIVYCKFKRKNPSA